MKKYMNLQRKYVAAGAAVVVALALCFMAGRRTAPAAPVTPSVVKVDTLIVRDTITQETPVYRTHYVRDSIYVTLTERDTVYVALPREVKVYENILYRAEVSGYEPSLDRIELYLQERVITRTKTETVTVKNPTRWGVGVQVGYGLTLEKTPHFAPYVGVGLSYNIISW